MTSEELERDEKVKRLEKRAENYSMLAMIACGVVGLGAGAFAGGEITRTYSSFFEKHYYMGDLCRVGGAAAFAALAMYLQDNLDPIRKYLKRKFEESKLENIKK